MAHLVAINAITKGNPKYGYVDDGWMIQKTVYLYKGKFFYIEYIDGCFYPMLRIIDVQGYDGKHITKILTRDQTGIAIGSNELVSIPYTAIDSKPSMEYKEAKEYIYEF